MRTTELNKSRMRANQHALTHEDLKEILNYCPESGLFTWKRKMSAGTFVGDVAGTLSERGYTRIKIRGVTYQASRLAWFYITGVWPLHEIDHINQITDDNRITNLRDVPPCVNGANKPGSKGFHVKAGKYEVYVSRMRKRIYVGRYETEQEAHTAYLAAKAQVYPELGTING